MSDNTESLTILDSYHSNKVARNTMLVLGTLFLVASLTQVKGDEPPTSFKICIGSSIAMFIGSWIPQSKGKLQDAINVYNQ